MMTSFNPLVEKSMDTMVVNGQCDVRKDPNLKRWKFSCLALVVLVIILFIAVIILSTQKHKEHGSTCTTNTQQSSQTPTGLTSNTKLTMDNPRVFQDLTLDELNNVRDYLLQEKALELTIYQNASIASNFIMGIELMLPPKAEVKAFLSGVGKRPERQAKVMIFYGAKPVPSVKEFVVGPLPKPNQYKVLKLLSYRDDVPYTNRPFTVIELLDAQKFLGFIISVNQELIPIIMESFQGHFMHETNKLTVSPGGYGVDSSGEKRFSWTGFKRVVPGWYLHNLPLEFLIEHSDPDFRKWTVQKVFYNEQYFDTISDFISKYKAGSVKKIVIPWPSAIEIGKGSMNRRGSYTFPSPLLGPTLVEPSGRRYSIQARKVSYAGWTFDIGNKLFTGPAIYNVKFQSRDVAYEISIQELGSFYSSNTPKQSASQFLDSFIGLGAKYADLRNNVDCPQTAQFLDIDYYYDVPAAKKLKNAICVFEMREALPSRRHTDEVDGKPYFVGGHAEYALYVRGIIVAGNYDYIVDYAFYQNGAVVVKVTPTGYLNTNPYFLNEDNFGFQNFKGTIGTIHDHIILYKVDLDVDGMKNSFQELVISPRDERGKSMNDTKLVQKYVVRDIKKTEKEAAVHYSFDKPKYYTVINSDKKNQFGYPVGYRIVPQAMVKQVYPDDYFVTKSAPWTKYQIAVTKQKEAEREASSPYNQFTLGNPIVDFDKYLQDNDTIDAEDLVTWVSVGGLHIPNLEDIPNTVTTANHYTFALKPYGFLESDPTLASRESYFVSSGLVEDYGLPKTAPCPMINRTLY